MFASTGMRRFSWVTHNLFSCRARGATRDGSTGSLAHLDGGKDISIDSDIQRNSLFVPFRFFFKSVGGGDGNGNECKHFTGNLPSPNGNRGNGGVASPKPKIGRLPFLIAFYFEPSYFGPTMDNELAATAHALPANCERSLPHPPWTFPPNHPGRSDQSRIPASPGRTRYRTSARARMSNGKAGRERAYLGFDVIASGGRVRWD